MKTNTHSCIISCSFLLRMGNVSDKSFRENQNRHKMFNNIFFFRKSCLLWVSEWNNFVYSVRKQTIIWCMRISCWVTKGNKHTLRICDTYCFPTTTVVARTRLNVTLYVRCTSFLLQTAGNKPQILSFHVLVQAQEDHKRQYRQRWLSSLPNFFSYSATSCKSPISAAASWHTVWCLPKCTQDRHWTWIPVSTSN